MGSVHYAAVFTLIEKAFKTEEYSNHREQFLVERLRGSDAFIPELSLVYEHDGQIIGYTLLTKIKIENKNTEAISLPLARVVVSPKFQAKGIGAVLIETAHQKARELRYGSVVLLGHENYYPRFGYQLAEGFGMSL